MKKITENWKSLLVGLLTILTGSTWYYVESNTEGSPMASSALVEQNYKVLPTPMDSINPSLPYRVYRVHYLTYRTQEISGQGLPSYQAKDYYNEVELFAVRGRFDFTDMLPQQDSTIIKVFTPVVFLGEQ